MKFVQRTMVCVLLISVWISNVWAEPGFVLMASTIGPIDAGIVSVLEDAFEEESGIRVRHVGAGTGAALKIAEKGSSDLVMVHAKLLEEAFVANGFGTYRVPLMYNDFVILGPASDPAAIKGFKSATKALQQIAAKAVPFVSRGDKSGTHVAELELWKKAGLQPAGNWYKIYEKGSEGNAATLKYTDQQQAYTVIDRATYLSLKQSIQLVILTEGDEALLNRISLIPVSQKKFPKVNSEGTLAFIAWLTAVDKGQKLISEYGKEKYGSALFFPDSRQWHEKNKK